MNAKEKQIVLNDHVLDRIGRVGEAPRATVAARKELSNMIALLAVTDKRLANAIEEAANGLVVEVAIACWIDGFQCGRDPLPLVLKGDD